MEGHARALRAGNSELTERARKAEAERLAWERRHAGLQVSGPASPTSFMRVRASNASTTRISLRTEACNLQACKIDFSERPVNG
jgi:hypothetical protein